MRRTVDYIRSALRSDHFNTSMDRRNDYSDATTLFVYIWQKKKNPNFNMLDANALACHVFDASPLWEGDQELPKKSMESVKPSMW